MKKIFLAFALLASVSFMACDPVEDSFDAPKNVTQEEFDVTAKTVLVTEDGEEYAVGIVENHSPIPSRIEYVVPDFGDGSTISGVKNGTALVLRTEGDNTFIFHGMNPDGTEVTKTVVCVCPQGKRKKVLPALETIVWEPIDVDKDGNIDVPTIQNWGTAEARFSDAEGVMGKWDGTKYDALISDKTVYIEFNKEWEGEVDINTGWWSNGHPVTNPGKKVISFYFEPSFVNECKEKDLAFIGHSVPDGVQIIKMYTLMDL